MSRTRKDRPTWVRSNDVSEQRYAWHNCGYAGRSCDIDDLSTADDTGYCSYFPVWNPYADKISRSDVHHHWWSPERVRTRDDLIKIRKNYNAGNNCDDVDFFNYQHRHDAGWWY